MSTSLAESEMGGFFALSALLRKRGWKRSEESISVFVGRMNNEHIIELININKTMFRFVFNPTDEMKRLHELRWML